MPDSGVATFFFRRFFRRVKTMREYCCWLRVCINGLTSALVRGIGLISRVDGSVMGDLADHERGLDYNRESATERGARGPGEWIYQRSTRFGGDVQFTLGRPVWSWMRPAMMTSSPCPEIMAMR